MYKNKTFLAIIPARGGSKRLPRKNILDLCGKPLIAWSIEAGLKSKYIDKIVVSSDDDEILDISVKFGADTIKRPSELASDTSTTFDAIKHSIDNLEHYDYVVLLQPTSPLRNEKHIDDAIDLLDTKKADFIISVCECEHSPLWTNTLSENLKFDNFLDRKIINTRSQDLTKFYRLNGSIFIANTDKFLHNRSFYGAKNSFAFIMPQIYSIDIDTELDFEISKVIADKQINKWGGVESNLKPLNSQLSIQYFKSLNAA
ncbi:acylneuraminate cytidylyltransferase family protein [Campylobacter iguaniorum]|nr:acylneuraminate cytidylyltransferase family protein [Campylobacter iguaniorum]